MSGSGTTYICVPLFERDMIIHFEYDITYEGCAAKTYGPPENCYPAEAMEYDIKFVGIEEDIPGKSKHAMPNYLDTPKWLEDIITEYLYNSDRVYDAITKNEEEW